MIPQGGRIKVPINEFFLSNGAAVQFFLQRLVYRQSIWISGFASDRTICHPPNPNRHLCRDFEPGYEIWDQWGFLFEGPPEQQGLIIGVCLLTI